MIDQLEHLSEVKYHFLKVESALVRTAPAIATEDEPIAARSRLYL